MRTAKQIRLERLCDAISCELGCMILHAYAIKEQYENSQINYNKAIREFSSFSARMYRYEGIIQLINNKYFTSFNDMSSDIRIISNFFFK